jgi:hypothetical protein
LVDLSLDLPLQVPLKNLKINQKHAQHVAKLSNNGV